MNNKLMSAALLVSMCTLMSSCDEGAQPAVPEEPQPQQQQTQPEMPLTPEETPAPGEEDVRAQLLPILAEFPCMKLGPVQMETTPTDDGYVNVTARVLVTVEENLYAREEAPAALNQERQNANDAINRAMLPDSHYLLQVGAPGEMITEEDRHAKPLPEELHKLAEEMKTIAEKPLYRLRTPAQTMIELPASMRAEEQKGSWIFSEMNFDIAPLHALLSYLPESSLPKDATIAAEGYEAQKKVELRNRVEAFNQAAAPYIAGREDDARKRLLERQAREEEQAKAAAEKSAQQAACHEVWEKACANILKEGTLFDGEWRRGDSFGKMSLRMARVQTLPDSLQFIGTLYDPDLPQAELQIVGRCEAPAAPAEPIRIIVNLYNGRYDPDVPTAEVFDSQDGILKLSMTEEGALSGVMTCASWGENAEKEFRISMAHVVKKPTRRSAAKPRPASAPTKSNN